MWIKVVPVVITKGFEVEFEYTVMNMDRMYFYQRGSYQSSWSWSWSPVGVTVERPFGFSLCAAPPRSFLRLNL